MRNCAAKLAILFLTAAMWLAYPRLISSAVDPAFAAAAQRRSTPQRNRATTPARTARRDYSKFSHRIAQHRQACDSCHKFPSANWNVVRKGDAAFPDVTDYPQHASCINCHRAQFFSGARPAICTVCHTRASPRDPPRHPFPNPAEIFDASPKGRTAVSQFNIFFPHAKHEGVVASNATNLVTSHDARFIRVSFRGGAAAQGEESCSVCHQTYQPQGDAPEEHVTPRPEGLAEEAFWLKRGTFKTTPNSHAACFTCHSIDSGIAPAPTDCATCHKLIPADGVNLLTRARGEFDPALAARMGITDKTTLEKWSRRDAGRFRHEFIAHDGLSCASCHNVAAMNTADGRTKKVPVLSCGGEGTGCHIEKTTEGILNLAIEKKQADPKFQCTKCHINNGSNPTPRSHLEAVATIKAK